MEAQDEEFLNLTTLAHFTMDTLGKSVSTIQKATVIVLEEVVAVAEMVAVMVAVDAIVKEAFKADAAAAISTVAVEVEQIFRGAVVVPKMEVIIITITTTINITAMLMELHRHLSLITMTRLEETMVATDMNQVGQGSIPGEDLHLDNGERTSL